MTASREHEVVAAFVAVARSLAVGSDVMEVLSVLADDCARLLDVASAGLLLVDRAEVLHVVAASSEATHDLELFQLQREQGPCLDCYRTGTPVSAPELLLQAERWPQFVDAAAAAGFASVHAVPLRVGEQVLGTLGLFGTRAGAVPDADLVLAQGLADVASAALVHADEAADATRLATNLQHALNSRVVIEQAKGFVAHVGGLEMRDAFEALRRYARDRRLRVSDVCRAVVSRDLRADDVLEREHVRAEQQGKGQG